MRATKGMAILALLALLLAGCSDSGSDEADPTTTQDPDPTGEPTGSENPEPTGTEPAPTEPAPEPGNGTVLPNNAPDGVLTVSIEAGQVPLNVTFDMDGSDMDGDDLSWTLDVLGNGTAAANGTALPANFTYTYETEGLYNVSFTISDGTNETVIMQAINVTAAEVGGATDTWDCTVVVPSVVLSAPNQGIGGCPLGTLEAAAVFSDATIPSGCSVQVAAGNTGGVTSTGPAALGTTYEAGSEFSGSCSIANAAAPNSNISATFTYLA